MKNTYYTSYFPLLSIILFSLSLAIHAQMKLIDIFIWMGLYEGMLTVFSEQEMKLTLLILLILLFFMIFSALKLVAQTINELSLLFFSNDREGDILKNVRSGSVVFLIGGVLSILTIYSFWGMVITFFISTIVYFIYFVYKISETLSLAGLVGVIFFQVFTWGTGLIVITYSFMKWYNILLNSFQIPS